MNVTELAVLAAGVEPRSIGATKRKARFVCVPTVQLATDRLRQRGFDLVIVRADLASEDNIGWVERLRAAKPFLPVAVLIDGEQVSPLEEVRLRKAGVAAVLNGDSKELQTWLNNWLARQAR